MTIKELEREINNLKSEIKTLKEMIAGLDFAIKNHQHRETDLTWKLKQ